MEVVKERSEKWRAKVMEKTGSLVEKVITGEVEGRRPAGEDLGSDGEMNTDIDKHLFLALERPLVWG